MLPRHGRRVVAITIQPLEGVTPPSQRRCPACRAWAWSVLGVVYGEAGTLSTLCTPFCEQCGNAGEDYLSDG